MKKIKAYQLFVEWLKDKAQPLAPEFDQVLKNCQFEVEQEDALESKFRSVVEDALQDGGKSLDLALDSFLREWVPKGRPN